MLKKNEIIRLTVTGISNDGNGVGRYEGQAIFVPFTAVGDILDVRIVKVMRSFAYGIIENVIDMTASVYDPVISGQNAVSRFFISVYYYSFESRIS